MKKILLFLLTVVSIATAKSQPAAPADTHLLQHYFELKDALVNSDAIAAAYRITDVINALNGSRKISDAVQKKLLAAGKDLNKQREAFAFLSVEMYALVKSEKQSPAIIYQQYCPMKKASWLSKEPAVRNPYYGNSMLTCGNVTATIKP